MNNGTGGVGRGVRVFAAAAVTLAFVPGVASPDTLEWALVQAYQNNPTINSQRAAVRATDESVPQALSGYRPKVSATASVGEQYLDQRTKSTTGNTTTYS